MPLRFRLFFPNPWPVFRNARGPSKGAFDNPTPRQYLEAICRVRTLYDLDRASGIEHESLIICLSLWSNAKSDIGCFKLKAGHFKMRKQLINRKIFKKMVSENLSPREIQQPTLFLTQFRPEIKQITRPSVTQCNHT